MVLFYAYARVIKVCNKLVKGGNAEWVGLLCAVGSQGDVSTQLHGSREEASISPRVLQVFGLVQTS